MNGSLPLGRFLGVPLRIHWSAPLLVILLGSGLTSRTLPAWVPGLSSASYTAAGLIGALLLLLSLLLHEAAHAVIARRAGITVQDMTVWGLGGVTRMGRAGSPRVQLAVSLAGPLTSLALGGLGIALAFGLQDGLHWRLPAAVLAWTGLANLLLGAFNLLPAAPLDGGRVLQAAVWWRGGNRGRAEKVAGRSGQVAGLLMVAGGWVEFAHGAYGGLWLMLIGIFVATAALAEVKRVEAEDVLHGVRVAEAMTRPVITGPDWVTVDRFLAELAPRNHHSAIPLVDFDARPSGIVELRRVATLPAPRRAEVRIAELAIPLGRCTLAAPDDQLTDVLARPDLTLPLRILVVDASRLVGIVTGHDVSRTLAHRRTAQAVR